VGTSVCECLDKSIQWVPNGSNCSLGNAKKTAYVNAMRTRWEPFNNAALRADKDRAVAEEVTAGRLDEAKAEYEAERAAWVNWWPYRYYWDRSWWWYKNQWWPITARWNDWTNYRSKVWKAQKLNNARQDFIDERELIEAKHEATPFSNNLDLIVGALPDRPGAGFTPSSIWSSATQSNELGRERNAATERLDPQLSYEFNDIWGSLDANRDDDQSWSSASEANLFGMPRQTYTESLFAPGERFVGSNAMNRFVNLP